MSKIINLSLCVVVFPYFAVISGHKSWDQLKRYERIKASQLVDEFKLITRIIFTVKAS